MRRLQWLIAFAIDYGSIALVGLVAAIYLWGTVERLINPPDLPPEMSGIGSVFGALFVLLAMKLWREVREDRKRGR